MEDDDQDHVILHIEDEDDDDDSIMVDLRPDNARIDVIAPDMIADEDDCSISTGTFLSSNGHYRRGDRSSFDITYNYPMTILYGSETGRAEEYAREMALEADGHGFHSKVMSLDEAICKGFHHVVSHGMFQQEQMKYIDHSFPVIIIVSTQCEGNPPDNALKFNDMLYEKSKDSGSYLTSIDYCIFGLGDSMYGQEYFNATGKKFDNNILKLGAERLLDLCCGDDDQDLYGDFTSWKLGQVWPALRAKYIMNCSGNVPTLNISQTSLSPTVATCNDSMNSECSDCPFVIDFLPKSEAILSDSSRSDHCLSDNIEANSLPHFTAHDCMVTSKRELRSNDDSTGSTLHIEIDVSDSFEYCTGDLLGVLPQNHVSDVERLAHSLRFDLDDNFIIIPSTSQCDVEFSHIFPTPCSVRECLMRYCDLTSPLTRYCLRKLQPFATSPRDFMKLTSLLSSKDDYQRFIVDGHIGLVDMICNICPSINMSLQSFIFICRRLRPRFYAIASSSLVYPGSVHFAISLAHGVSNVGRNYMGVCSTYLQQQQVGNIIRVFRKESKCMRPPTNPSDPVLLVGPGVGISALRAILQERSYQRNHLKIDVGRTILYFGCKNHWLDNIYANELDMFRKEGTLDQLQVAYSREHVDKVYVQYLLARNADEIFNLFHKQRAILFLGGGEKMGNDVCQALVAIFAVYGNLGPYGALTFSDTLKNEERWNRQTWE